MLEITDRDEMLLKCLAEYGVISVDSVGEIYQTKHYHVKRISRLADAKYINRKNGLVTLSVNGRNYLKEIGVSIPVKYFNRMAKKRRAKISEVGMSFLYSDFKFIPSWQAKEFYNLNNSGRFLGLLENEGIIVVYNIGKKPSEEKIFAIKEEMKSFISIGVGRAVIFAESKKAMDMYKIEPLGLDEQLLLPYGEFSIKLIKHHLQENLKYKSAKIALKDVFPSRWVLADYNDSKGRPVVVLTLNNIEKRAKLKNYYKLSLHRHTNVQEIIIVCLESQERLFKNEFPQANLVTISEQSLF